MWPSCLGCCCPPLPALVSEKYSFTSRDRLCLEWGWVLSVNPTILLVQNDMLSSWWKTYRFATLSLQFAGLEPSTRNLAGWSWKWECHRRTEMSSPHHPWQLRKIQQKLKAKEKWVQLDECSYQPQYSSISGTCGNLIGTGCVGPTTA